MKILFIGDVVGPLGLEALSTYLPRLKKLHKPQVTVVNAENSANGRGITEKIYKNLLQLGVDVVTLGNHSFDNQDIFNFIEGAKRLIRPANYPEKSTPGTGITYVNVNQYKIAVINLMGLALMSDNLNDPFEVIENLVQEARKETPIIFIDFHAEATSEMQAMGWYLDGEVSAVIGTHTHVQTSDARILPKGTAYLTDVGMTGPYDAVLGMKKDDILRRFVTKLPTRFNVEDYGRTILSACVIDVNEEDGSATSIVPIMINADQPFYD